MAPRDRSGPDHLTHFDRLIQEPEKHHIFHAMRIVETAYPDVPRLGESRRPREDVMRFGQEAELSFPPSSVRSITRPKDGKPGVFINRFFGFFGPNGPLPLHLTEYARDRQRNHRDSTIVAFANTFTHRLMTLLYRAWREGQPAPSFDRGRNDPVETKIAAIAGYHGAALRKRDALPDVAKRHFAGLLSQGPKNAEGLVSILSAFFEAEVALDEFIGCWLELEPGDRWTLGGAAGLGQATSIGTQVWTRNAKFRLRIGPLNFKQYERLLPGSRAMARLDAIVRGYVGDAMDYEVNLILKAEDVPPAQLGKTARLGHVAWSGPRKSENDANDLVVDSLSIRNAA